MTKAKLKKKQQRAKGLKKRRQSARATPSPIEFMQKGIAAFHSGDYPEAEAAFRSELALRPNSAQAMHRLGTTLLYRGRDCFLEARQVLESALAISPSAGIVNTLALVFFQSGESEEAESVLRDALAKYPRNAGLYETRGHLLIALGLLAEARQALEYALELQPSLVNVRLKLAEISLLDGDFLRGFKEFESAPLFNSKGGPFILPRPRWRGEDIAGKRLYVIPADGYGDTIQFARFLPGLKLRTRADILFRCQESLAPLFMADEWEVICDEPDRDEYDCWVPIMSLPAMLNVTREQIATEYIPYPIAVPSYDLDRWAKRVRQSQAFKVGLVWAGNSTHSHDYRRSFSLADMAPLATVPGVEFYSLQIGDAGQEAQRPPAGMRLHDFTSAIDDFLDTAALIENLDLLISVDTSVVHLASSLNKSVWIALNPFIEWRWEQNRHSPSSVWYPSARLFIQPKLYDWRSVFESMARELMALVHHQEEAKAA